MQMIMYVSLKPSGSTELSQNRDYMAYARTMDTETRLMSIL